MQNPENTSAKVFEKTPAKVPFPIPVSTPIAPRVRKPKWEKTLPKGYTIMAAGENSTSLKLKVEIETTDPAERESIFSLVDSGATGEFIDRDYAKSCQFNLIKLTKPILVYNVDGTPNEAGSITEVVNLLLCYKNHSERTTFAVTSLGKQKLLLGHSWLCKHNPEIDWVKGEVKCPGAPHTAAPGAGMNFIKKGLLKRQKQGEWTSVLLAHY